ncbi:hypothetical protein VCHA28FP16_270025 [Vibrio chagasii]|nr:hypothetical protein VCHA28FP16_270025 [Vibrio chagasii]
MKVLAASLQLKRNFSYYYFLANFILIKTNTIWGLKNRNLINFTYSELRLRKIAVWKSNADAGKTLPLSINDFII